MRRDPTPGFSMLLFGVSLACYSPSLKSVQDQAYTAAVVVEGKVQALPPPPGSGNGTREPPASAGGVLVKVLDLWPRNSGGLQREQLISVGSAGSPAPCFKVKRNHRYIFFLEPTEQPLVFRTSFAPLDTSGKNLKKDVGRILCADCGMKASEEEGELSTEMKKIQRQWTRVREKIGLKHCCSEAVSHLLD
ncbi:pro-neuregulin-2, membrane-bound isoform-like isoform X1 [Mauremys reevesii]|uniref:pro-neuregulin-2, membrane-bound isoform-like isoform X1 n=1 Tax=Mauremys reevesii TaxID=260615 RepID=UPI00193F8C0C|nr:pro-neuregulin-2, membrane-bound isoform-like isoform X1 [Mauremys reevesii]XP_039341483.1 pro-neuregulin-2, membrane-bound isoform-like isoform X1 [Mauremys reevesii]